MSLDLLSVLVATSLVLLPPRPVLLPVEEAAVLMLTGTMHALDSRGKRARTVTHAWVAMRARMRASQMLSIVAVERRSVCTLEIKDK